MGRTPDKKRIVKEDFDSKYHTLIEKLSYPINSFFDQVIAVLNKGIDFQNLNQELLQLIVTVDVNGIPTSDTKLKSGLVSSIRGMTCVRATNITTVGEFPTTAPFVTFVQNGNILTIQHVSGIQSEKQYRLDLLAIG